MARVTITATAVPAATYNLTDSADFTALSTGAGNGVQFTYNGAHLLVLKNTTGGTAAYTIKVPTPAAYTSIATIPDDTVSVGTLDTHLVKLSSVYKQSDGMVYVDCDVAGSALLISH
jgi:hypothetical protein